MKQITIKTAAILMLLMLITNFLFGQKKFESNYFLDDQIKFSISPVMYENLRISNWGEKLLKSRVTFSAEASILYYKYLKNNFGINIGVGLGLVPYNIHYGFNAPENSIFQTGIYKNEYSYLDDNLYDYVQSIWTFPISIEKFIKHKPNLYYSIEAGLKLNRVVAFPYEISNGYVYGINDSTDARLFDFYLTGTKKNIFSYFLKVGLLKKLENQNSLQFNLILNFSFTKIGIGYYEFENLPYESRGQIGESINYIGFEFVYGLTLFKEKKIRNE